MDGGTISLLYYDCITLATQSRVHCPGIFFLGGIQRPRARFLRVSYTNDGNDLCITVISKPQAKSQPLLLAVMTCNFFHQ